MVLLNQRVYYEGTSQPHGLTDLSTTGTYSINRGLHSGTSNPSGETSLVQFPDSPNRFDLKPKMSDEVELGRVKLGAGA